MKNTKRVFLCAILATIAFISVKDKLVFSKEVSEISLDIVEGKDHLFRDDILWKAGDLAGSSIEISNDSKKDLYISKINLHNQRLIDYVNLKEVEKSDKRYKKFFENDIITIKNKREILFEDNLEKVFLYEGIVLEKEISLKPNESSIIDLDIKVSENLGNEGQGLKSLFNISFQYEQGNIGSSESLPNTGGFSSNNFILFGALALCIGSSILKLPQKKEDI